MFRYLAFAGFDYEPGGGWDDFKGDFGTLKAAWDAGRKWCEEEGVREWHHVVDTKTKKIVQSTNEYHIKEVEGDESSSGE